MVSVTTAALPTGNSLINEMYLRVFAQEYSRLNPYKESNVTMRCFANQGAMGRDYSTLKVQPHVIYPGKPVLFAFQVQSKLAGDSVQLDKEQARELVELLKTFIDDRNAVKVAMPKSWSCTS